MTSFKAIFVTIFVHALLGQTIFFEQGNHIYLTLPIISSYIFLLSTLIFLYYTNLDFYNDEEFKFSPTFHLVIETLLCIFYTEFATVIIWRNLEKAFFKFFKCIVLEKYINLYYDMGSDTTCGVLWTFCSIFILTNVIMSSDILAAIKKKFRTIYKKYLDKFIKMAKQFRSQLSKSCNNRIRDQGDGLLSNIGENICANENFMTQNNIKTRLRKSTNCLKTKTVSSYI